MKRGERKYEGCGTEYCDGALITRCWLCGGITSECSCGDSDFDCCICKAQASCWADVKLINFINLGKNLFRQVWYLFKYGDDWWLLYGWRGK